MSHDEPASQPSPDASSAAQPTQHAELPSTQHGKPGERTRLWTFDRAAVIKQAFDDEAQMISSPRHMR